MSDDVELADVPALFERWLAGRPLAERSRREYARNVRVFCGWLADTPDRAGWQGDPLTDPLARDHAARDFRRYLQVERRAAASTVNLALASLDALYRCLGLGRPHVRRDKPALAGPRALDEAGQRRLLRAAEAAPIRPRSLVMLMLFTALRISETVALDVDDVRIMTRKGVLVVIGKGDVQREAPLNALVRQVLDEWLEQRKELAAPGERALWVSRTGGRLSARSADRDVRAVAAAAGLELSAHTLRHTCLTGLVRRGNDLVMVAELAGHQKLETTRRYTLPSAADRQRAVEDLQIDY
jgi:integrase/recombinase XerC